MEISIKKPVENILKERGQRYGDFGENAEISQSLKEIIRGARPLMPPQQLEALDLISTKISRIVTGDWSYVDNWDDIAGYATLIANRLRDNQLAGLQGKDASFAEKTK